MTPQEPRGTAQPEPAPPLITDHTLVRRIGRGSYGDVWLARSATGAWRAVKIIHRRLFSSDRPYEREFRGLQSFESLSRGHESQVDVLHVGRNDHEGVFYYVMELADDEAGSNPIDPATYRPRTLRAELNRRGRLPLSECVDLGLKLVSGLAYLHENGLLHRDVKPSNIIYVDGAPKLADIGLVAPQDATVSLVGTLGYLPPEGPGTPQADIYGLGKVLYEASTGKDRQHFPEPATLVGDQEDFAALAEFNEIVLRACAPEPRRRYRIAAEIKADLQLLEGGKSVRRVRKLERNLQLAIRGGALILVLAALALVGFLAERRLARKLEAVSEENRARAIQLNVEQGVNRMDQGDLPRALLWFVEALRLAEQVPGQDVVHRTRIAAVVQQCPRLLALGSQQGPLYDAVFSPDGHQVAVGGRRGVVSVISPDVIGQPKTELQHPAGIRCLAFSTDGQRLATGCEDGTVRIWSPASGRLLLPPLRHEGTNLSVVSVVFSRDGRLLASATKDGQAQIWDAESGRPFAGPFLHHSRIADLAMSPDAARLLTAGADGEAKVWTLTTISQEPLRIRHRLGVNRARFTKDGARILTASDDGTAAVWHAGTGERIFPPLRHRDLVFEIQESPDGSRFLTAGGEPGSMGEVMLWDAATGSLLASLPRQPRPVLSASFSPDGRQVVTASVDGDVRVWDSRTGDALNPLLRHNLPITAARFAPDGRRVLTAGKDGIWKLWDLASEESTVNRFRTRSMVTDVRFTQDGRRMLSGEYTTGAAMLGVDDRQFVHTVNVGVHSGNAVSLSPNDRWLAMPDEGGTIQTFDAASGQLEQALLSHSGYVYCSAFSPDSSILATGGTDRKVILWRHALAVPALPPFEHSGLVYSLAFSPDGHLVATGSGFVDRISPGEARIWDTATGKMLLAIPHAAAVSKVRFSPDGRLLLTTCSDSGDTPCPAQLWKVATGEPVGPPMFHGDGLSDANFSPDGLRIVTAGDDATVRIWEAGSGRSIGRIMKHRRGVRCAMFSPDGRYVLSGSADGTARLWDATTGAPVSPPIACAGFVRSIDFSPDGRHFGVGSGRWSEEGTRRLPGEAAIVLLAPTDWKVADLESLAQVLSGKRLAPETGELVLDGTAMEDAFRLLRKRHPEICSVTAEDAFEWHRREAESSRAEENQTAAMHHLQQCEQLRPADPRTALLRNAIDGGSKIPRE